MSTRSPCGWPTPASRWRGTTRSRACGASTRRIRSATASSSCRSNLPEPTLHTVRIVSLVPSATEMLFAMGAGTDVVAVTHECDFPPEARDLPKVTRDVIGPGLDARQIDEAVRELTSEGRSIYELDEQALTRLQPDL